VASKSIQRPSRTNSHDQALFFAALTFAHCAFCAAATFFLAAADRLRLLFIGTIFRVFRAFAHRALWAAAIRGRPAAERLRGLLPFTYVLPKAAMAAVIPDSSLCNRSSSFFSKSKTSFKTDIQFFPRCGFYPHLGILGPDTITCFGLAFDAIGAGAGERQLTLSPNEASTKLQRRARSNQIIRLRARGAHHGAQKDWSGNQLALGSSSAKGAALESI
jgi:hypothetical protein